MVVLSTKYGSRYIELVSSITDPPDLTQSPWLLCLVSLAPAMSSLHGITPASDAKMILRISTTCLFFTCPKLVIGVSRLPPMMMLSLCSVTIVFWMGKCHPSWEPPQKSREIGKSEKTPIASIPQ